MNFNNGNVNNNNKSNTYYVRAVRGGKCSLFSWSSLYQAYLDCRRWKRGTINALQFEVNLLENLFDLALRIQKGTYQPSRSVCFVTARPKYREIFAADFRDRVVHHLVVRRLEKVWEPRFIHDSYASRSGKGIHAAVQRVRQFMRQDTKSGKRAAWYLQLDIRSFFMSIDKNRLFALLERDLPGGDEASSSGLLYLLHRIIFHDCTGNYRFKGNPEMLSRVPPHKTLFNMPPEKGLPIGNLTSQFFANVYLNELDQFVKHRLKCRHYVRYVDDLLLVSPDREQLCAWREEIRDFLREKLDLRLKDDGCLRRVSDGADFLGYIVRPAYLLVRNRVVGNLHARLMGFAAELVRQERKNGMEYVRYSHDPEAVCRLRQTLASYLGHFKHASSYNLTRSLFQKHRWLNDYFLLQEGALKERYKCGRIFRRIRWQIRFFRRRLSGALLFFKIGRFYELFEEDARWAGERFGLKVVNGLRRQMGIMAGFPVTRLHRFVAEALNSGREVAVVEERGLPGRFVRDRYVGDIFRPGRIAP